MNRRDAMRILACVVILTSSWLTCQVKSNTPDLTNGGVTRGTVNVILGNENGIIALTDSRLTETLANGVKETIS